MSFWRSAIKAAAITAAAMMAGVFSVTVTLAQTPSIPKPATTRDNPHELGEVQPGQTLLVETRLITLDVTVTDREGRPVTDLKRDDFIVTEDRVPQTLRSFETPDLHVPGTPQTGTLGTTGVPNFGDSPLTLFVLDEISTRYEDMSYARFAMRQYLERQPPQLNENAQLLALTNKRLDPLTPFTRDRDALLAILSKRRPDLPYRLHGNGGGDPIAAAERLSDSLAALAQLAQAYAGEHGRKNVIWLGHGFPSLNLDNVDPAAAETITAALHATAALLVAGRIVIYTVDPAGLPAFGASAQGAQQADGAPPPVELADATDTSFEDLTTQTGGRAFRLRNDVDVEVATSVREGSSFYSMSYTPSNHDNDSRYRRIVVTTKRPGLIVRTRDGYYADPRTTTPPEMVGFEMSQASVSSLPYTGLLVTAESIGGAVEGQAVIRLKVAPQGLTWRSQGNGDRVARFLISTTLSGSNGATLAYKVKDLATTAKNPGAEAAMNAALQYTVPVTLVPHTAHVRVVVRDETSGRTGSADLDSGPIAALIPPHKIKHP